MELTIDLYVTMTVRITVLFICGAFLFYKWFKVPRHYTFDLPFLMGVSFTALAVSKVFDIFLYQMFYGEDQANQNLVDHPGLIYGYIRWLFMLVVFAPLLYANLRVWVAERARARGVVVGAYVAIYAVLILQARTFAGLQALLPAILLPVVTLTVLTFLFAYTRKRLPNVHGLIVGIGWAAYLVTNSLRPMLLSNGTGTFGLVSVAELLDMLAWLIIFAGLVMRPGYARTVYSPVSKGSSAIPSIA